MKTGAIPASAIREVSSDFCVIDALAFTTIIRAADAAFMSDDPPPELTADAFNEVFGI